MQYPFSKLNEEIRGDVHWDEKYRKIYATDASVYREYPAAVALPKDRTDIIRIVDFCKKHTLPIIPRATGTSLAGQCVGNGMVLDISKYMDRIIEINPKEKYVIVEPGVIRDELNRALKPHGLFFGPNTSTANRATLGGMLGNNSCGSTSIVYGSTRDHILEVEAILSDGSTYTFGKESASQRSDNAVISNVQDFLKSIHDSPMRKTIAEVYPDPRVKRRNTGYAIDYVMDDLDAGYWDMTKLLAGSEGTLAITTQMKVHVDVLPDPEECMICIHFDDVLKSMQAIPDVMGSKPFACELMDKVVLDCTKGQATHSADRFFIEGDPQAVLMVSFVGKTKEEARNSCIQLREYLIKQNHGYTYPIIEENIDRVWNLRKAGLGLLANIPGDKKAVACIEDTAVRIDDLYSYIKEFTQIMANYGQEAVYYAHAGDGELHLRPILDLKKKKDRQEFYDISKDVALLAKKYKGSMSGEHGDGRVRAPFIKLMYGAEVYDILRRLKHVFDPDQLFNPGKIIDPKDMLEDMRYDEDHITPVYDTIYNFSNVGGIVRMAEKCNGSGDCRKKHTAGGTMCPSYHASASEDLTTRARANVLREVLTREQSPFENEDLMEVLSLCLSCKGCTAECPSNVNMTMLKSEVLYQHYQKKGMPRSKRVMARLPDYLDRFEMLSPFISSVSGWSPIASMAKRFFGVHPKRSLPAIARNPFKPRIDNRVGKKAQKLVLYIDEFTKWYDVNIGRDAVQLLEKLDYEIIYYLGDSGRSAFSLGDVGYGKDRALKNIHSLYDLCEAGGIPVVGIEPSTILSFRDEYLNLCDTAEDKQKANILKSIAQTIEEFLYEEVEKGSISQDQFKDDEVDVHLHGHCHQKALSDVQQSAYLLSLPARAKVSIIPSGCCGMAGSFGYDAAKYDLSMSIGELSLFPHIRSTASSSIIVASGTSCRHQIEDGTHRKAVHPVSFLLNMLK